MNKTKIKKHLVAVYGSLLKGLHNNKHFLSDTKLIGEFDSKPEYTLYDLGSFPGLVKEGYTSVRMEIYEVNTLQLKKIDSLEGFTPGSSNNHYDRIEINTPFGKAYTYIYAQKTNNLTPVINGDWKEFMKQKSLINV